MKTKTLLIILFLATYSYAQENLSYQKPSKEILELADVELAPAVQIDSKGEHMVLLYRNQYKSIAELSEKELRLAGLRINPITNIGSRTTYYTNLKVKKTADKDPKQVTGLPKNPRLSGFSWSPDESMIACLNTTKTGVKIDNTEMENEKENEVDNKTTITALKQTQSDNKSEKNNIEELYSREETSGEQPNKYIDKIITETRTDHLIEIIRRKDDTQNMPYNIYQEETKIINY